MSLLHTGLAQPDTAAHKDPLESSGDTGQIYDSPFGSTFDSGRATLAPHNLLALQRTLGNQAVGKIVSRQAEGSRTNQTTKLKNPSLTPKEVLQLQRTIGNQAVQRILTGSK